METEEIHESHTQHEPHKHAKKRVVTGVLAGTVLIGAIIAWYFWGSDIKEACLGEEVCAVELPDSS